MVQLVRLTQDDEARFRAFADDFLQNDPDNAEPYQQGVDDFSGYLTSLEAKLNPQGDREPLHFLWLVDGGAIKGAITLRDRLTRDIVRQEVGHIGYDIAPAHRGFGLGHRILELGLIQAANLGLSHVMVVADVSNVASRRVIERNGGKLIDEIVGELSDEPVARYTIDIQNC